jgi:1,4-dihydroxy-2-naphthoate octaprenyltransferase
MATPAQWVAGARPRTLAAAVAPVILGTGAAAALDRSSPGFAILALVVALSLQVGVNYANDYSDGIRGTDETRVGPVRLVGQHLARPENVRIAAFAAFGFAALAGLALVALSGAWLMILLGVLAIVAAWRYTGGDNPYGYRGLGEAYVFVFFGLVATLGTLYTQALRLSWSGLFGAVGVGSIASALLVANNLRDIPTDTMSGKRTLAVRLGDRRTRLLYLGLVGVALVCVLVVGAWWHPSALLALLAFGFAVEPARRIWSSATGRDLVPVLAGTGAFELAYAVLFAIGLAAG